MSAYVTIGIVLGVGLLGIAALVLVSRAMTVAPVRKGVLPFGSGWDLQEHALSRFHTRWYPMTLVFLAFDVEMLFMYPWAVVVAQMGAEAVIEMFVFLGVLVAGVVWAWREGAFRWV
ncbi:MULTISPECIES: NADH-quinone oxidoreductase subunit A [unclassified Frigoribacterium]|uniref:NADH-quinone oxidoreductase subunit A n=1 Tax=unclassified Frigoribacterium TaxID=2627005 RepID=UPI000F4AE4F8|nr:MULTISPECIES: NADH-quinone oxidoreductase subunit A [unclassified Frigoribacterium]ROS48318.1 NADH dehydrogenase subunit A [Frigoribacterium sp. PhB118]ROS49694.1 NADH dehydrogenase subunit A [Frigoribacterium sp. PhB24]TWX38411.1 NADH-quinone oxidoreductase subunit A [Frigoribacterium sp. ACAM 257]